MLEVLRKTITIETSEGNYNLVFCPAVPKGYKALNEVISKHIKLQNMARAISKEDNLAGAVRWIADQAELAEEYIRAIEKAVDYDSFMEVADILEHISVESLSYITVALVTAYNDFYKSELEKLDKELEP